MPPATRPVTELHGRETRLVPMLREYTVFNVDQCENLPDSIITPKPIRVRNPDARDGLADAFLHSTGADIREGHGEACYIPSRDFISMPAFAGFKGADHFYSVAFHELTHWTGHKARLDRDLKNRFGSRNYAAEELIAELGAAFLCAEFGFDGDVRNAGYIGPCGLDQEFNSLDAQYDAASAYIRSQAHAGWTLIRSRYDDGGYSGGSTDRPDLQRLLAVRSSEPRWRTRRSTGV